MRQRREDLSIVEPREVEIATEAALAEQILPYYWIYDEDDELLLGPLNCRDLLIANTSEASYFTTRWLPADLV